MSTLVPQLIILRGPIGAGKTSVAECLRDLIKDVSLVDFDTFKRLIDDSKSSDWRRKIALDTALYMTERLMQQKRLIVVDIHSSKQDQLEAYTSLARTHGYQYVSYLIQPPLDECIRRATKRIVPDIRYPIDEKMINEYWQNTVYIKGERVFRDAQLSAEEIAQSIISAHS